MFLICRAKRGYAPDAPLSESATDDIANLTLGPDLTETDANIWSKFHPMPSCRCKTSIKFLKEIISIAREQISHDESFYIKRKTCRKMF